MTTKLAALLVAATALACGGNDGTGLIPNEGGIADASDASQAVDAVTPIVDAAPDVPVEAGVYGAPSSTYPAFTPWMGQLSLNGGPLLTAPEVVTITWDVDTGRSTFESFGDEIGGSTYWSAAVGEYGVGPVVSGASNHVHVTSAPPAQWGDSDVQSFITANIGGLLPSPTSQTIYVFYIAPGTTYIFDNENACNSIGGYHDAFPSASSPAGAIAYAVLPNCSSDMKTTQYASHEIGEASTDPQPEIKPGLLSYDDPYMAFFFWQRNNLENGDACEFFPDSDYVEQQPFPFQVQRLWSNKQGPLGHSPCQPYTATYFNVAPLDLQDITVDLTQYGGPANFTTKGYACNVGQSIQIPIGIYSDGATGPISVSVAESNPLDQPVTGRITLSIDPNKTSGVNGEKTFVDATVTVKGPIAAELLTVITQLGTTKHYLPLLVGTTQ
jgi:hypothetical protein